MSDTKSRRHGFVSRTARASGGGGGGGCGASGTTTTSATTPATTRTAATTTATATTTTATATSDSCARNSTKTQQLLGSTTASTTTTATANIVSLNAASATRVAASGATTTTSHAQGAGELCLLTTDRKLIPVKPKVLSQCDLVSAYAGRQMLPVSVACVPHNQPLALQIDEESRLIEKLLALLEVDADDADGQQLQARLTDSRGVLKRGLEPWLFPLLAVADRWGARHLRDVLVSAFVDNVERVLQPTVARHVNPFAALSGGVLKALLLPLLQRANGDQLKTVLGLLRDCQNGNSSGGGGFVTSRRENSNSNNNHHSNNNSNNYSSHSYSSYNLSHHHHHHHAEGSGGDGVVHHCHPHHLHHLHERGADLPHNGTSSSSFYGFAGFGDRLTWADKGGRQHERPAKDRIRDRSGQDALALRKVADLIEDRLEELCSH